MELYRPISFDSVLAAWSDFSASDSSSPFGIYVHLPFCARKCSFCYCDTVISAEQEKHSRYVAALEQEMALLGPSLASRTVDSLYLGGGTPTYLGEPLLRRVFQSLQTHFRFDATTHLNVESTPGSITPEIAALLGEYGTDRVTLGIQSLDEQILSEMNRPQTFEQIEIAVTQLRDNGVAHINFDLVGGLTEDTAAGFERHFDALLKLSPEMVHVYPYSARPAFPESPEKKQIIKLSQQMVHERGYRSIKNDGWGKSDASANVQVKQKIEDAGSCLGLGVRARSHVFGRLAYLTASGKEYEEHLSKNETPQYQGFPLKLRHQVQRYLIDNLRQGVSVDRFQALFGGDVVSFVQRYAPALATVLEVQGSEVRTTKAVQSGREIQTALYDPAMKRRLYLQHIGQPKGWPVEKMTPEAMAKEPDWNWLYFLATQLTKGNTYPPITGEQRVSEQQVYDAWSGYTQAVSKGKASPVAGIYCHVPFCSTKCKFCYCYSIQLQDKARMTQYVRAVQKQVESIAPHTEGLKFQTLYFGGGTPSLLPPTLLDELLATIHGHFEFAEGFQFNFEGTPQTLGLDGRIAILARHGLTRLTIGIQSLEQHLLKHMDRAQQTRIGVGEVVAEAREQGIQTVNVDVLAGLPQQTFDDFQRTFEEVLSWRPDVIHPYPYQNTAETRFHAEGFRVDPEVVELRGKMMEFANRSMADAGYLMVPNESWCLGMEHRNQQDVDKVISSSSVLPLGYVARGHVFGALTYGTLAEDFQKFMVDPEHAEFYYGSTNTPMDEQVRYINSNLRAGFSRVEFEAVFGVDCLESFWWQFTILQKLGKVRVTGLDIESRMQNSSDTVLFAKLFFADKYHDILRAEMADKYDPDTDYRAVFERLYERNF
jgi:oxygen-independent coproporphyrinogen-3 oxidase